MSGKKTLEEKIQATKDNLKENLNTIRAGRANPALLDKVMVDYYGSPTPIKALANVSVPDPRTLLVTPFDPKSLSNIEKGINEANIGINPSNDGKVIRLVVPTLTEERRKELAKDIKKKGEDAKVIVRNARRDANEAAKKQNKAGELSDDEYADAEDDLQKATDKFVKEIDKLVESKTKEVLTV